MGKPIGSAGAILSLLLIMAGCNAANTSGALRTIDHKVPHVSTVPANEGEQVEIFLREKVMASGGAQPQPVVLMVHGGVSPSTLAFDVEHETYSWMGYLARAGFDVFAMDMTGYGKSAHPKMDDPCNVSPALQKTLIPKTLDEVCKPPYPFQLVNRQSEHDELDRVIEYIRNLRGVDKVNLLGWSGGGYRTGHLHKPAAGESGEAGDLCVLQLFAQESERSAALATGAWFSDHYSKPRARRETKVVSVCQVS